MYIYSLQQKQNIIKMLAMTHMEGQTPTNSEGDRTPNVSDDEGIISLFRDSDEEYKYESEYESEDADHEIKTDVNPINPVNNYWSNLGTGNVLNPLPQRINNRVHVTRPAATTNVVPGRGRGRGQTRVITEWFTNVGSIMGVQRNRTLTLKPTKKVSAFIFQSTKDIMKCTLTIDGVTHYELNNSDVQMKLISADFVKFSIGSGQIFSLSSNFAKWIINDYEPHMWREVGIHIYLMFGNDWSCLPLFKAKAVIEQCLGIWKNIKKEVYTSFCEIVLEREYTDDKPVPDSIKTQINRAMWKSCVKDPYQSGFAAFRGWYESKLLKQFNEKKSLKEMKKEQKDDLFHHMFNFCGLYTMHNRVDGVVNHVSGIA